MPSITARESEAADAPAEQRDRDIVVLIASGNINEAFERIMQRYKAKVFRLCVAYMRDPAQAEDAAQESLLRLWRALSRYDGRAALSTWIYAITRNGCLTCLRKRRDPVSLDEAAIQAEVDSIAVPASHEGLDQGQAIRELVAELPEVTRRIVTLYYFEEQSVAAVAKRVGLPEGTIKTHLFRARTRLRTRLEALGLADPAAWTSAGG
jgi:RNA polymerase sigma-70 factor (ECF subfamily)